MKRIIEQLLNPDFVSHEELWRSRSVLIIRLGLRPRRITPSSISIITGLPGSPVINSVFGCLWRKTASRGGEGTRVWYRETVFSQMVSYDFLLHGLLHEHFLYLVSAPPGKPRRCCEPEEGYLRCSKRFDHRSHFISFVIVRV